MTTAVGAGSSPARAGSATRRHACSAAPTTITAKDSVAATEQEGASRIVGHVCLEPARDGSAEIALAVADELQGRGIGRALVDASVGWAHEAGIDRFSATMLSDNVAIRRLLTGLGIPARIRSDDFGVDAVTLDLSADARRAA